MSIVELERPSPTGTANRHAVPARLRSRRPAAPLCGQGPFDDLAVVFPSRRLSCTAATALVRRRTPGFDACASATAWLIGEGLESLDPERRRRVLEGWSGYRDHGAPLVGDAGCDVHLGSVEVEAAERAALLSWLPITNRDLAVYEGGLFEGTPAHAIALLVRPPTIWSLDEALLVEQLIPRGRHFAPDRFVAIERHACSRTGVEHVARLRRVVARIAAQLPDAALPVARATVAAGSALVAADDAWARWAAARQLARYASSEVVAAARDAG